MGVGRPVSISLTIAIFLLTFR